MALRPTSDETRADQLATRRAAEQDVLLREVDEAVRQDEAAQFARRYGILIAALLILALAAFGGWLWWKQHRENMREKTSETFVQALDYVGGGDLAKAQTALDPVVNKGQPGAAASAKILQAGLLVQQGKTDQAAKELFAVADDGDAPQQLRNLALIRGVAANFDKMKPQDVVDRLKPLAKPGNPWFPSAGELVAMAYLNQGKKDLAGPLFASIAKDEQAPETMRSRTRQMAGMLGYDAVVDVNQTLAEVRGNQADAGAAAQ